MSTSIAAAFASAHPDTAAQHIQAQPIADILSFLDSLEPEAAAIVLAHFDDWALARSVEAMADDQLKKLLIAAPPYEQGIIAVRAARERAFSLLPDAWLTSDPDLIGSLSDAHFVRIGATARIRSVLDGLAASGAERDPRESTALFVVDETGHLLGTIDPLALVDARNADREAREIVTRIPSFSYRAHIDTVLGSPHWISWLTLPLLDEAGRLVGSVRRRHLERFTRPSIPEFGVDQVVTEAIDAYLSLCAELLDAAVTGSDNEPR